jgi:predicted MPP superfamily phosphohydrolase
MTLFLAMFFLGYGLLHFYALIKIRTAFTPGILAIALLVLFMFGMILAPVGVRLTEKAGLETIARLLSHIGYTWMGVIFLFFASGIFIDMYRLLLHVANVMFDGALSRFTLTYRRYVVIALAVTAAIAAYAYFEALHIRTERITIVTPKLPAHASPLRIVQISDVHLGLIVREARLARMLEKVKEASPDILVSTGDLADGQINNLETVLEPLKNITPRYGKFAITGNHEFYAGLSQALDFTRRSGFTMLRDATVRIGDILTITGVDDPAGAGYRKSDGLRERALLGSLPQGVFRVLLKHRPDVDEKSTGLFDLQLSGHVHKGQIFPFFLVVRMFYPFVEGSHRVGVDAMLHVNRGSGTWGPPMRFLAPPEITVIDVVHGVEAERPLTR